jgi:holliday junction DNA helicase RuvA
MIEYIKGILIESSPLKTVVEVGGIGYRLYLPLNNYSKLPAVGTSVLIYISTVIREDSQRHYGFLSLSERDLFEVLIEVSGIGPKTALALLGHVEASDLQLAISQSNLNLICKVPGIGKKTAERLIVEMRDRFQKNAHTLALSQISSQSKTRKDVVSDALSALVNLGYHPIQAQKAVRATIDQSQNELELPELITNALRHL